MKDRLCILRCGLGRDSIAMLCLLVEGGLTAAGGHINPQDLDAVVFSDTGSEWPYTIDLIPRVRAFCERHGLRLLVQEKPPEAVWRADLEWEVAERARIREAGGSRMPSRVKPWQRSPAATIEGRAASGYYHDRPPLLEDYWSRAAIPLKKKGDCTGNHKIVPGRAIMEDLAIERFGAWATNKAWGKAVRAGTHQPHLVLLGIAADEPGRAVVLESEASRHPFEDNRYPLLEMGISKPMEQEILDRHGFGDVKKSGCFMCKWQGLGWYWALRELEPDLFAHVVAWEAAVVERAGPKQALFPRDAREGAKLHKLWISEGRMLLVDEEEEEEGEEVEEVKVDEGRKAKRKKVHVWLPMAEQVVAWRKKNPDATIESIMAKEYQRSCPASGFTCKAGTTIADIKENTAELLPLDQYDRILIAFSGGKDSLACVLTIRERLVALGVDPQTRIELWHHAIDGRPGSEPAFDWPCTESYCKAVAQALGLPLYFSWREGGFIREMNRWNTPTAPVTFQTDRGEYTVGGDDEKLGQRHKFPQVSPDLKVRWCSPYLKIMVMDAAIRNHPDFEHKAKVLVITGERREESASRARYAEVEEHDTNADVRKARIVHQWRPVIDWTQAQVWAIIQKYGIEVHPCYRLGYGRCSCMICIFGGPDEWATVARMSGTLFRWVAATERAFGATIQHDESVEQQAARGNLLTAGMPEAERVYWTAQAKWGFTAPIALGAAWTMPRGAFRQGKGAE